MFKQFLNMKTEDLILRSHVINKCIVELSCFFQDKAFAAECRSCLKNLKSTSSESIKELVGDVPSLQSLQNEIKMACSALVKR